VKILRVKNQEPREKFLLAFFMMMTDGTMADTSMLYNTGFLTQRVCPFVEYMQQPRIAAERLPLSRIYV
jgi:hypothetical protein